VTQPSTLACHCTWNRTVLQFFTVAGKTGACKKIQQALALAEFMLKYIVYIPNRAQFVSFMYTSVSTQSAAMHSPRPYHAR
jgi:hypothetical protein